MAIDKALSDVGYHHGRLMRDEVLAFSLYIAHKADVSQFILKRISQCGAIIGF